MKKVIDFEILDHGVENSQYFQGCGVAFTDYDDCFTGVGSSKREALDDVLEQLASSDIEIPSDLESIAATADDSDAVSAVLRDHYGDTKYVTRFSAHCGLMRVPQEWGSLAEARSECADWITSMRRRGAIVRKLECYKWEVETAPNRAGIAVTDDDGILSLDIEQPDIPDEHELYYHVSVRVKFERSDVTTE